MFKEKHLYIIPLLLKNSLKYLNDVKLLLLNIKLYFILTLLTELVIYLYNQPENKPVKQKFEKSQVNDNIY